MAQSTNREQRVLKATQMVKRLEEFVKMKGENMFELTKSLKLSNSYFNNALRGEGIIGSDVVIMILEHYRDLSPDYLLFGTGSKHRGGNTAEAKMIAKVQKESELGKVAQKAENTIAKLQKMLSDLKAIEEKE
jgi:hypothetical protein